MKKNFRLRIRDDVPEEVKQQRASHLWRCRNKSLSKSISKEWNNVKMLVDRKEGDYFIGRTAHDSPEVDNEVLVDARAHYLRIGDFAKCSDH
jgi:ribosomal protein S12 methylthiotransferase